MRRRPSGSRAASFVAPATAAMVVTIVALSTTTALLGSLAPRDGGLDPHVGAGIARASVSSSVRCSPPRPSSTGSACRRGGGAVAEHPHRDARGDEQEHAGGHRNEHDRPLRARVRGGGRRRAWRRRRRSPSRTGGARRGPPGGAAGASVRRRRRPTRSDPRRANLLMRPFEVTAGTVWAPEQVSGTMLSRGPTRRRATTGSGSPPSLSRSPPPTSGRAGALRRRGAVQRHGARPCRGSRGRDPPRVRGLRGAGRAPAGGHRGRAPPALAHDRAGGHCSTASGRLELADSSVVVAVSAPHRPRRSTRPASASTP